MYCFEDVVVGNVVSRSMVGELPECCEVLNSLGTRNVRHVSSHRLSREANLATDRVERSLGYFNNFNRRKCNCGVRLLRRRVNRVLKLSHIGGAVLVNVKGLNHTIAVRVGFRSGNFRLVNLFSTGRSLIKRVIQGRPVHDASALSRFYHRGLPRITVLYVPGRTTRRVSKRLVGLNIGTF